MTNALRVPIEPNLAARQASALVNRVVATMRDAIDSNGHARPRRKLTLFVGHDTNLANIGGMLGMHWALPSYLPDQTPPAGALHFELLRNRGSGSYVVRVTYVRCVRSCSLTIPVRRNRGHY